MHKKRTRWKLQLPSGSCHLRLTRPLGLLSMISVKPFADVVAYYTRQNGEQKTDEIVHVRTSSPLERVDSLTIIP